MLSMKRSTRKSQLVHRKLVLCKLSALLPGKMREEVDEADDLLASGGGLVAVHGAVCGAARGPADAGSRCGSAEMSLRSANNESISESAAAASDAASALRSAMGFAAGGLNASSFNIPSISDNKSSTSAIASVGRQDERAFMLPRAPRRLLASYNISIATVCRYAI